MNIVLSLLGWGELILICGILYYAFFKQNVLDRYLSKFNFLFLLFLLGFILIMPFFFILLAEECDIEKTDLIDGNIKDSSLSWAIFHSFFDPGTLSYTKGDGRIFTFFVVVFGVLLMNGFLVSTLVGYYERHVQRWQNGEVRYNFRKMPHVIILGGHNSVISVFREARDKKEFSKAKRFIIMTTRNIPEFRRYLQSILSQEEMETIILYNGSRTSVQDIQSLNISRKSVLATYVIGEGTPTEEEPAHDSQSLESVKLISKESGKRQNRLLCYMMFQKLATYNTFQLAAFKEEIKSKLIFEPYNYYEMWAQQIIACPDGRKYKAIDQKLDKDGNVSDWIHKDSDLFPHLIIIGMGRMGLAIAQEAALCCHYPNFKHTRITLIDKEADIQMRHFVNRAPSLFEISRWKYLDSHNSNLWKVSDKLHDPEMCRYQYKHLSDTDTHFMDVDWEFIKGDIDERNVVDYLNLISKDNNSIISVYVCLPKDNDSLSAAVWLPVALCDRAQQVLVQQVQSYDMIEQLSTKFCGQESRYKNFVPFGKIESSFVQTYVDVPIAKKIYSKNYKQIKDCIEKKADWRNINWEWDELPPMKRWSAVYSSHGWFTKFRSLGVPAGSIPSKELLVKNFCKADDCDEETETRKLYGEVEHNRWIYERLLFVGESAMTDKTFAEIDWEILAMSDKDKHTEIKNGYKDCSLHEHLDICSLTLLKKVDPGAVAYDMRLERTAIIYDALIEDFSKKSNGE